jgi:hypothetical protein
MSRAVADETYAAQVFEVEQLHDVFDVAIQVHVAAKEVLAVHCWPKELASR